MRRSPALSLALLVLVGIATVWGFATLLGERYGDGVSYPVYSTLRVDPLGAKAFFESLDRMPGYDCVRNYQKLAKLQGDSDSTLILLHVAPEDLQNGRDLNAETLKSFAATGGRVIITIDGQSSSWEKINRDADLQRNENAEKRIKERLKKDRESDEDRKSADPTPEKPTSADDKTGPKKSAADKDAAGASPKKSKEEMEDEELAKEALFNKSKSASTIFGFVVTTGKFVLMPRGGYELSPEKALPLKPVDLPLWYSKSSLVLEGEPNDRWEVLAKVEDDITLAQYRVGRGSIIFATDSYFASNEGLWKEPSPRFLAWLIGGAHKVIFDETHLGTQEKPGIMTLARRYRLQGLFIGGIVLFALFVWRSSSSLLPQREEKKGPSNVVAGQGAAAGLVSLLKRGLSRPQLLQKGLEAWERQQPNLSPAQAQRLAQARTLLPTSKRLRTGVLADTYRRISAALHPKTR